MVVCIETVEGKIKKYHTIEPVYPSNGGDNSHPEKYIAHCGREWKDKPKEHEECDHIDCALYLAKRSYDNGPMGFVIYSALGVGFIIFIIWENINFEYEFLGITLPLNLLFYVTFFLAALHSLIEGLKSGKQFDELKEYKQKGTINGVRAWRIYKEP